MSSKDFRFGISRSIAGVDLNKLLISHPSSTYFMRLENEAKHLELNAGDILQIDRSLTPKKSSLAVVYEVGEPEMKVISWKDRPKSVQLWGVVEAVIRDLR